MTTTKAPAQKIEREAHLRWIPVGQMKVSPLAQREFSQQWAEEIAAQFSLEDMGTPVVNFRESFYYILDGQHTVWAARQALGLSATDVLQCWTYEGMSEQEEAEKFLRLNNKKNVQGLPKFRIAVVAGRRDESDIDRIVRANGLRVGGAADSIGAVGTLQRVYQRGGPAVLGRTLRIIRDAYGDEGFEAPVIDGLGMVCQRYNGSIDDAQAVLKLSNVRGGHNGLMGRAETLRKQTGNTRSHCLAAAVVEVLNKGRGGTKLPDWFKSAE